MKSYYGKLKKECGGAFKTKFAKVCDYALPFKILFHTTKQVVELMYYLHFLHAKNGEKGIAHRDIKLSNTLISIC